MENRKQVLKSEIKYMLIGMGFFQLRWNTLA